ncbi:MAG: TRAP transporter large permease [Spirochaetales bacterium]|nr:TRAP transporter large permease [Spirochaetales bacterium]
MLILLVFLLIFAVLGIPVAFAIGASSLAYIEAFVPEFAQMLPQRVWGGVFSYLMIAMPLFMLAGELMNTGGITRRIIDFSMYVVRPVRGGLGEVNIIGSMLFGGISGSSVADTSALGSILIPAMQAKGYPPRVSAGITVASSTMGMIIPPSVPMIVYAMVSGASVGKLFIAALIPGLLIGILQLIVCYVISVKKNYHPRPEAFVFKHFLASTLLGLPAILMPLIIIIFISFGICTASESAGIAVLYSLFLGFMVYRELTFSSVIKALKRTLISSSAIMLIIGFTMIFTWLLTMANIPSVIAGFFLAMQLPAWGYGLMFVALILVIGTFVDVSPAILLLTPIMLPIMREVGFSDLQFGAMMITGLAIGLVTPPVGMCLNACTKINKMPIAEIFKGAAPFVVCNAVVLVAISVIPGLTTWLPSIISY